MNPAQKKRSARKQSRTKAKKRKKNYIKLLLFPTLVVVIVIFFNSLSTWTGDSKLIISTIVEDEARIVVLDPRINEISVISIPGNTEVKVARGLGNWKINAVWDLGTQEGYGGKLLSETFTNHIMMPSEYWWDESLHEIMNTSMLVSAGRILKADSSFGVVDRFKIAIFASRVRNTDRKYLDLSNTSYLDKGELKDGTSGYLLTSKMPKSLLLVLANENFANNSFTVEIVDSTDTYNLSDSLGQVISITGAKVASIKKEATSDLDCIIKSENEVAVKYFSNLFDCSGEVGELDSGFDMSIEIGKKFSGRF